MLLNDYVVINSKDTIQTILRKFDIKKNQNKSASVAIYFKKKKVSGILSLGDLRRIILKTNQNKKAIKFINKHPIKVFDKLDYKNLKEQEIALKKILQNKVNNVLVLKKNKNFLKTVNYDQIKDNTNYKSICIAGLGHIGIPLVAHILKKAEILTAYDNDLKKIKNISKLHFNFFEPGLNPLMKYYLVNNKINLVNSLKNSNSNIFIICIGQDVINNKINSKNIINCLKVVAKKIFKGNLIIIRGTTQIGFCRKIANSILEKYSGLKCGKDFYLSHMSERIVEGKALEELENLPQLVSGYSSSCLKEALKFSNQFFKNSIELKSLEESEMIKLVSNSYRDLNFAFSNEISRVSNTLGLSGEDLIQKANSGYPRNNIAKPSLGVGGYCLPKDTVLFETNLINYKANYKIGKISREVNNKITKFFADKITKQLKKKSKVLIIGIAFKGMPETIDTRNSPSTEFAKSLRKKGVICNYFDVKGSDIRQNSKEKDIILNLKKINIYDVIVFANNNKKYQELFLLNIKKNNSLNKKYIFDTSNIINESIAKSYNYEYLKI